MNDGTLNPRERDSDTTEVFGFWLYLMTDFVLFASLFATYAVLRGNTFGGPGGGDVFDLRIVLPETLLLLSSSFTCGLSLIAARDGNRRGVVSLLSATGVLGASFVAIEVSEFARLLAAGNGPARSGFLSAYFALVGTHGLHVALGAVWIAALLIAFLRRGLSRANMRKLALFSLFWHFLDIVWIFIFTFVYLFAFV